MPTGLNLAPATGIISGTPSLVQSYSFTIVAANGPATATSATYSGTVAIASTTHGCAIAGGTLPGCTTIISGAGTGTWTVPDGVTTVKALVVGGGSAGMNGGGYFGAAPGGGSGYVTVNTSVPVSGSVAVTIGAGENPGANGINGEFYGCSSGWCWNYSPGGGQSSFGGVIANGGGATAYGTPVTYPATGLGSIIGGSGGGGLTNTGSSGVSGGSNGSNGLGGGWAAGGAGQGTFPSFGSFTQASIVAGAGGQGGLTMYGSGGGGGGVTIGASYPSGGNGHNCTPSTSYYGPGYGGAGFGGGGGGGCYDGGYYSGGTGANGVVYIEW